MSKLIIKYNDEIIEEIPLKQGDMTVGRRPGSDVLIDNLAVSGNHASIFTVGDDSFIQDLESTNGTLINNKRITKHHLKHGDVVTIGKHSLVYVSPKAAKTATDEFAKTVVINPSKPVPKPEDKTGAIFILSGANSGKRIDLTKSVTNLGRLGKPAGVINRTGADYVLAAVKGGEIPKLNGKPVSPTGEPLKHGDIIEVGDSRLQFNLK